MKKSLITITLLSCTLLTACSSDKKATDSSSEKSKVSLVKKKSTSQKVKDTHKSTNESNGTSTSDSNSFSQSSNENNSNSSSDIDSEMSFDEAASLIEKGGFTDFNLESAQNFHDGSHPTSNGGYVMITYPGAKGMDTFTITKISENKYHIDAEYGSLDGGTYTKYPDDGTFGPSSADVTK